MGFSQAGKYNHGSSLFPLFLKAYALNYVQLWDGGPHPKHFVIYSFNKSEILYLFCCRDDGGRLVRTERLRTKDITHRVKMKNYWQVDLLRLPVNQVYFFCFLC